MRNIDSDFENSQNKSILFLGKFHSLSQAELKQFLEQFNITYVDILDKDVHIVVEGTIISPLEEEIAYEAYKNEKSFPTPRSWEYVDKILKSGLAEKLLLESISGAIGKENSVEFMSYRKVMDRLPDIQKIAEGEIKEIQEQEHKVLFALCAGLVNHFKEFNNKEEIDNVLQFSMDLPSEFSIMLVKDMQNLHLRTLRCIMH